MCCLDSDVAHLSVSVVRDHPPKCWLLVHLFSYQFLLPFIPDTRRAYKIFRFVRVFLVHGVCSRPGFVPAHLVVTCFELGSGAPLLVIETRLRVSSVMMFKTPDNIAIVPSLINTLTGCNSHFGKDNVKTNEECHDLYSSLTYY